MNNGKSCAITGHRVLKNNFDLDNLNIKLKELINQGYDTFYLGMARGFDLCCCGALLKLKEFLDIKVIACIPCLNQEKSYLPSEKVKYYEYLKKCDDKVILNEQYITGCMQQRNRYMVDNADALFVYIYKQAGGTFYTLNYAKDKNKQIIFF